MNDALYQAEAAVLGAMILNADLVDECYLEPVEFFADGRHGLIMEYIRYCYEQDGAVDFVLMAERSGNNLQKIGGITYLTQLTGTVPTQAHFDYYQGIIRNAYIQRLTAESLESMATMSRRDGINIKEQITAAQARLEELAEMAPRQQGAGLIKMAATLDGHVEEIKQRQKQKGMTGPPTVSVKLDKLTGGHQRGDFEIVAARPSMGKTAYMNNDALRVARNGGAAVAIFSAEMKSGKVTERMLCAMANLDNNRLRSGALNDDDWVRYSMARDELDRLPIYIDDTPGMTLQHIRREVKRMVKTHPNMVVYIDYLQLIIAGVKFSSRAEEVAYISRSLKLLARQYGITVVALSQLSRGVEQRQDKRPMLSDLRESGAIEQDGDIITFLYRDDYYNKESEKKNIVELIVAKGRDVGTGTVEMVFLKNFGKFADLDDAKKGSGHEQSAAKKN